MFCTNCGTKLEDNSRFCHNCGASTGSAEEKIQMGAVPPPTPSPTPKKKFPVVLAAILAIVVVVAAIFLLPGGEKVNPEYTALLEKFGVEDESILQGKTKAFLSDMDGTLIKLEYGYQGNTVTEMAMYIYYPFTDDPWSRDILKYRKEDTETEKTIVREDYYVSVTYSPNLDTEEGVREYYGFSQNEEVDLIKLSTIVNMYTELGYIPRN